LASRYTTPTFSLLGGSGRQKNTGPSADGSETFRRKST
jgi:hypothetical protein